jgi:4-amino-4-deoxy-L-arabinose transferase-like glycosyltransferase
VERRSQAQNWIPLVAIVTVIAVAALLRLIHLGQIPSCLEYDEAANVILAGEIATGKSFPVFIRPYTGKEALYFYLAAGTMRLAGVTPFALRLTSAFLGVLTIALTYWLARELLATSGAGRMSSRWVPLYSAALVAVSYWQVNLSRFGYRAIVLPPLLALTFGTLFRALRTGGRGWTALAGAWAGLSAYTYSSVRVLPILLLLIWAWVLVARRRQWRTWAGHFLLFGLAAGATFAPLGIFFLRNPETFSVRLAQVSVLSPAVNRGDPWGTLWRTLRAAWGMWTVAGDANALYNAPGKPVFDAAVGAFFYLGLVVCLWQSLKGPDPSSDRRSPGTGPSRLPYVALLAWLVVMMVPNVLSALGVPHNLRAMAVVPVAFILTGMGLVTALHWAGQLASWAAHRLGWQSSRDAGCAARRRALSFALVLVVLVGGEGARTYRDYLAWAHSAAPYYKGNEALIDAAALIDAHPEAVPYVATSFQQHATLAVSTRAYPRIRWMSGSTLVLPPPGAGPVILIYDHTNPVDPLLRERYLPPATLLHREPGPDGKVGYEAYRLEASTLPVPAPQVPKQVNLGGVLSFLGYDRNAPASSSGELDVTLYFAVQHAVEQDDYAFFAHLEDDLGFRWAETTFFHYPSAQWRAGEVLIYRLRMPVADGAPPGAYTLKVGAFSSSLDARLPVLDEAGRMVGTAVSLAPVEVEPAEAPLAALPPIQSPQKTRFGDVLTFLGTDRDRNDLRPGQILALTLYWRAEKRLPEDLQVAVDLVGEEGEVSLWRGDPAQGHYPFRDWAAGQFVRDRYALRVPVDTAAGTWQLRLSLLDGAGRPLPADDGSPSLLLGQVRVQATDRRWAPPPFDQPVGARLGGIVELVGYSLEPVQAAPGETLHLTLIWRCLAQTEAHYTVFTHLLDPGGQVRGQQDNPPVRGTYPTALWVPGEIVVDEYEIVVAAGALPGSYAIEVGMYDPETMARLPVVASGGAAADHVLLGQVTIR